LAKKSTSVDLIKAAGLLKSVKRAGWVKKAGITSDCESVADHSFRMAVIAAQLGLERKSVDLAKLIRMCLIHDLAESIIGDKMPEEKKSSKAHRDKEDQVMQQILQRLPEKSGSILLRDWKELLESKTKESAMTWQIDKLEMALQAEDYIRIGYDREILSHFRQKPFDRDLSKLFESY
jgi:putative hydrolases of HD superfamily